MPIIEVRELTRDFEYYEKKAGLKGSLANLFRREKKVRRAVDAISFSIEEGEIAGFIGPNGAGKTTTLKMLSGILHPTSGEAKVRGYIPWERKDDFKRSIALAAGQKSQLWPDLPALETFNINKCIYRIGDAEYKATVDELASMLDVTDFLNIQVRRLSLGQKMKLELIASLLHKPGVLFLDEPTIGLDITSQNSIRDYLREYNRKTGATVILTSHYTKDIEELCGHTIIINQGKKVYDGTIAGIKKLEKNVKILSLTLADGSEGAQFAAYGELLETEENTIKIEVQSERIAAVVPEILAKHRVADFTIEDLPLEKSLEAIFGAGGEGGQ